MKRFTLAVICAAAFLIVGLVAYFQFTGSHSSHAQMIEQAGNSSALNSATVSFGGWMTAMPLDRFPNNNPIAPNHHRLTPMVATIKAGGTVNFIIGGFHHVVVYDDGTQPTDIDTTITVFPTNGGPPLIADPENRIYRGLDPSLFPQDRVEVVHFSEPGTYLVICGVLPHFQDAMYGFVRVLPGRRTSDDGLKQ